jgi:hypothetical protein
MAQGLDYVKCATALEKSIKQVMSEANVTIVTTEMLPHGDQAPDTDWKLQNDWQVYESSPYDETIKLEADMIIPQNISHWFDVMSVQDVVVSDCKVYRRFIDDNNLPDVYNAITYFKKSATAERFFGIVRNVFENWEDYKVIFKCSPTEKCTTDWAYAIACHIIGIDKTTMPNFTELSMVHMKQWVNGLPSETWTDTLVYELLPNQIRVNTYPQRYPFHYHVKSFSAKLLEA